MARLGNYVEQVRGVSYKPSDLKYNLDDSSVALLRANNIQNGKIVFDDVVYISKSVVHEKQYLRKGDILICTSSGSKDLIGKAAFIDRNLPVVFGAFCKVIRPQVECPEYVGHFFQSQYYRRKISAVATGANINNLRNEHIAELEIELRPLDDQRRIVEVLDKVNELISKRREQLDKLDLLVKSQFIEMFGDLETNPKNWSLEKLKDHSDIIAGNPFNSNGYTEDGVKICGSLIIMPDRITWEDCKYWPSSDGLDSYLLKSDDIVLAMDRPWISSGFKIAKIKENELPALLIQRTARIRGTDLNQNMILAMLSTKSFEKHCNITSTTVPHISMGDIKDFPVMVPPAELQNQFSVIVQQIDKSKFIIQQSLEKLEILKNTLMQEYFG